MNNRISPHFRSLAHIFLVNVVLFISTGGDALAANDRPPKFDVFAAYDGIAPPTYPHDLFAVDGLNEVPKEKLGAVIAYFSGPTEPTLRVEELLTYERNGEERLLMEQVNQIFLFADARTEKNLADCGPKSWTPEDKQMIKTAYEEVARACPSLICRAARKNRIRLYRVTKWDREQKGDLLAAFSHCLSSGEIAITDLFKNKSVTPEHIMAHELTHLIDCRSRFSASIEWTNLESQKLINLRIAPCAMPLWAKR